MSTDKKWIVWELAPESGGGVIITNEDGEEEVTGRIHNRTDADLIAAAPDLLRMCEYMIGKLEAESSWGDDNEIYLLALKDVVQKARGE